jgi:hypothetical protein
MNTKHYLKTAGLASLALTLATGCAAPLNSAQRSELKGYRAKSLEVREKHPAAAAALGILPGFGSFYTREYATGVLDLLFWPASVLWDPVNGYQSAESINYYATKMAVEKSLKKETRELEFQFESNKLSKEQYIKQKRAAEDKYAAE